MDGWDIHVVKQWIGLDFYEMNQIDSYFFN